MNQIQGDILEWVYLSDMTDEEKAAHPEAETTGGYLKELDNSECAVIWWRSLNQRQKNVIMAIPNFDKAIYAIKQFELNNIEFTLKNEQSGHFHCRRKSDDKLFQFWAGTGKILGYDRLRGIHSLIKLLLLR